jgi:hypothetical protein
MSYLFTFLRKFYEYISLICKGFKCTSAVFTFIAFHIASAATCGKGKVVIFLATHNGCRYVAALGLEKGVFAVKVYYAYVAALVSALGVFCKTVFKHGLAR